MILIDTSAWVEFLRDTGSPICDRVEEPLDVLARHTDLKVDSTTFQAGSR